MLCPYLDDEFGDADRTEVEAHLATCADCARKVHEESRFRTTLRARAQAASAEITAPAALRNRISMDVSSLHRRDTLRRFVPYAAAAAVLVVAAGSYQVLRTPARRSFLEDAAARHAKNLPVEVRPVGNTTDSVERWFQGKVDVPVRRLPLRNVVLGGARISNVKDREARYYAYEAPSQNGEPRRVGVFVIRDSSRDLEAPKLPEIEIQRAKGQNVAVFRDDEVVYFVTSELDERDIRSMLQQQPRGAAAPSLPAEVEPLHDRLAIQPAGLQQ